MEMDANIDLETLGTEETEDLEGAVVDGLVVATGGLVKNDDVKSVDLTQATSDPGRTSRARRADYAPISAKIVFNPGDVDLTEVQTAVSAAIAKGEFKVEVEIDGVKFSANVAEAPAYPEIKQETPLVPTSHEAAKQAVEAVEQAVKDAYELMVIECTADTLSDGCRSAIDTHDKTKVALAEATKALDQLVESSEKDESNANLGTIIGGAAAAVVVALLLLAFVTTRKDSKDHGIGPEAVSFDNPAYETDTPAGNDTSNEDQHGEGMYDEPEFSTAGGNEQAGAYLTVGDDDESIQGFAH